MVTTRIFKRWLLLGTFLFLLAGTSAFTQEKGKGAAKDEFKSLLPKNLSLVRVGYTRPGSPADKIDKNGTIIQAAHDQDFTGSIIGSTVYFAVFRGTEDGVAGSELTSLADAFVAGRSFENSISPNFDRKAKYLYLYQIVNDRGLNPPKEGILPAADFNINTAPISDFALRLLVDPRYITSWGHFQNVSFEANVTDRKVGKGGVVGAAEETVILPMALSSNPAVVKELPHKRFQDHAPAYGLGELSNTFGLGKSNLNLEKSSAHNSLLKKKADGKEINWVANAMTTAVAGGLEPDYVQIVYNSFKEDAEPTLDDRHIGNTIFRVDFKKNSMVKVGQHSVVFGFTTDLPPTDEPIRVEGPMPNFAGEKEKAKEGKDVIKEAAFGQAAVQGLGRAPASAVGTAPTPMSGAAPVGAMTTGMIGGGTPLGSGGVGGGVGLPLGGAGFGVARAPATAGGVASAAGNGSGQTTQAQNQAQTQQQQQTPNINFNTTLTNQQAQLQTQLQAQLQAQQQQQQQQQHQHQNQNQNNHHHHGHVVPEPSAIILGLLGLPALFFLRRRNRLEIAAVS